MMDYEKSKLVITVSEEDLKTFSSQTSLVAKIKQYLLDNDLNLHFSVYEYLKASPKVWQVIELHQLFTYDYIKDDKCSIAPFTFLQVVQCFLLNSCTPFHLHFVNALEDALLFCLLDPKSSFNSNAHCCLLVDIAADVLSELCLRNQSIEQWDKIILKMKNKFHESEISSSVQYSIFSILVSMGIEGIAEIIHILKMYYSNIYRLPETGKIQNEVDVWEQKISSKLVFACEYLFNYYLHFQFDNASRRKETNGHITAASQAKLEFLSDSIELDPFKYLQNKLSFYPILKIKKVNKIPIKSIFFDLLWEEERIKLLLDSISLKNNGISIASQRTSVLASPKIPSDISSLNDSTPMDVEEYKCSDKVIPTVTDNFSVARLISSQFPAKLLKQELILPLQSTIFNTKRINLEI